MDDMVEVEDKLPALPSSRKSWQVSKGNCGITASRRQLLPPLLLMVVIGFEDGGDAAVESDREAAVVKWEETLEI